MREVDLINGAPIQLKEVLDALSVAVAIVDRDGTIVATNRGFDVLARTPTPDGLVGAQLDAQAWLCDAIGEGGAHPWRKAMQSGALQEGIGFIMGGGEGNLTHLNLQAAPLRDGGGQVRGCLVSIDNVTQVHRVNEELLKAMVELDNSRAQIHRQNVDLCQLVNRDPLTGALNRRSFFDRIECLFVAARQDGLPLSLIMMDIDHFKDFNDRHGHTVGDEVLRAMVHTIQARLRTDDLLCRYGGEEFCIVLPGTRLEQAMEIAHRLRADVEARAGKSVRTTAGLKITASLGVAVLTPEMRDPAELIDRADKALYRSKETGRNRVTAWSPG